MVTVDATEQMRNNGHGAAEPDEVREISSADAMAVLASDLRRRVLALLTEEEATTGQLARAVDVPRDNLYHHLERLMEAGLVRVSREVPFGRMTIRFYRATARRFRVEVTVP